VVLVSLEFYERTKKRSAVIRNNRNYLLENIQPTDELIAWLLFFNCITKEKIHAIKRQRLYRDKNEELLALLRSYDYTNYSNFVRCLRRNNQLAVARILENGAGKLYA